jgi:hypothetical protein
VKAHQQGKPSMMVGLHFEERILKIMDELTHEQQVRQAEMDATLMAVEVALNEERAHIETALHYASQNDSESGMRFVNRAQVAHSIAATLVMRSLERAGQRKRLAVDAERLALHNQEQARQASAADLEERERLAGSLIDFVKPGGEADALRERAQAEAEGRITSDGAEEDQDDAPLTLKLPGDTPPAEVILSKGPLETQAEELDAEREGAPQ